MPLNRHRATGAQVAAAALALLCAVGCGRGGDPGPPPPAAVATVTLAPDAATVLVGGTATLTATPRDAAGASLADRPVTWSAASPAIATVSNAGLVTGIAPGTTTVTATASGRAALAAITVVPVPVATVAVAPATVTLPAGSTLPLAVTVRDAAGALLTGRAATWATANPDIATVSAAGVVTAVAPGLALITATVEGARGTTVITVVPTPVATVVVAPDAVTVAPGAVVALTATARDAAGAPLAGRVATWRSATPAVASVSPTGTVAAIAPGTATISATIEGVTGSATVTVRQTVVQVASVTLTPSPIFLPSGASRTLTATVRDSAGGVLTGRTVTWQTSNAAVATVSAAGVVTQLTDGTVTITAGSEGVSGSAQAGNRFPATGGSTTVGGAATSTALFQLTVPAGATAITVTLAGGTGDPDLYLYRPGVTAEAACESIAQGPTERCALTPSSTGGLPAGVWTVLVYGYTAYDGVVLTVSVAGN
jgi:uncharacterized protein YjdB